MFDPLPPDETPAHQTALECLEAGIQAAHPSTVIDDAVSLEGLTLRIAGETYTLDEFDRVLVLGGGKAAGEMAIALEGVLLPALEDGRIACLEGDVVASARAETSAIDVQVGDHPTPTQRNVEAANTVLERAGDTTADDLVLVVLSGGASALLCAPPPDIPLEALASLTDELLAAGAAIGEINAVRKHCSAIKGGHLARVLEPATHVTLAISDVVGDDPSVIGSGPTVGDETTYGDAVAVLERYDIEPPPAIETHLERGLEGSREETPDSDSLTSPWHCLATTRTALEAAKDEALERGYDVCILSSRIRGEARTVGDVHAAIAAECVQEGDPIASPAVFLSGGEVTVTVDGPTTGTGGPNQELALAAALELRSLAHSDCTAVLASADTDGIDGPTHACGGIVDTDTVDGDKTARRVRNALNRHDSTTLLEELDALLETTTGYTGTNVNDLRVMVVQPTD